MLEVIVVVVVLAVASAAVVRDALRTRERRYAAWAVFVALSSGGAYAFAQRSAPELAPAGRPPRSSAPEWVTSASCIACHPGEHASFRRTFHRTMTQDASARTVLAPLDGRALRLGGATYRLERRGSRAFADLDGSSRELVLVTGSHREQAYWVAGERPGELRLFPFVWMPKDGRFVARHEAFLVPPAAPMPDVRWGSSCIACHAVAGEPRRDAEADVWSTRVAELGVACEACHGPGRAHVERYRDPFARVEARRRAEARARGERVPPETTITNPRLLPPERSAALCGQCHAYAFPRDEAAFWQTGYARAFRAGEPLEPSRFVLSLATFDDPGAPRIEADVAGLFWPDGSVRVGGREYNGLVVSPCHTRGEGERKATCLSCHAMHAGDPAGQIAPDRAGDAGCTSCHDDARARTHGHHAAGSPGSACVACHMPRTSYALLSATRSHRIDVPSAAKTGRTGQPNACNLCHLDRSLAWTATWLARWYGRGEVDWSVDDLRSTVPEGLRAALVGDAAVRVVVADAIGRAESRAATTADGASAIDLARRVLARDPYAAVRYVAARATGDAVRGPAPIAELLEDVRLRELLARRDGRAVTLAE